MPTRINLYNLCQKLFAKLVPQGKLDAVRIWENEEFFAALDFNPNVKGMMRVVSKNRIE